MAGAPGYVRCRADVFYLLHLYVLKLLYLLAVHAWEANQGDMFGFSTVVVLWLLSAVLAVVLYPPTRAFGRLKARRPDLTWLRYF